MAPFMEKLTERKREIQEIQDEALSFENARVSLVISRNVFGGLTRVQYFVKNKAEISQFAITIGHLAWAYDTVISNAFTSPLQTMSFNSTRDRSDLQSHMIMASLDQQKELSTEISVSSSTSVIRTVSASLYAAKVP